MYNKTYYITISFIPSVYSALICSNFILNEPIVIKRVFGVLSQHGATWHGWCNWKTEVTKNLRSSVMRSKQIVQVYAELRRAVGDRATSRELLDCAAHIVGSYREEQSDDIGRAPGGSAPFWAQPLDRAFSDGGWRVMAFETRGGLRVTDEQDSGSGSKRHKLQRLKRLAA